MQWQPVRTGLELVGPPVAHFLRSAAPELLTAVDVAPIDPTASDTAQFCERYEIEPELSANCVVVAGKREGEMRYAACLVRATERADVNGTVRRLLNVRKASFLAMEDAVSLTGMAYGGITALGLPSGWRILLDSAVADSRRPMVIGSGVRESKLQLSGPTLTALLPTAERIEGLAVSVRVMQ